LDLPSQQLPASQDPRNSTHTYRLRIFKERAAPNLGSTALGNAETTVPLVELET